MRLFLLVPLLAFGAMPAVAATPEAYAALDRASALACERASGFRDARAGEPIRFSDRTGVDARLVAGVYPQPHMRGARGTMLCLYDRRARRAEVQDADAMLAAPSSPARPIRDTTWRAVEVDGRPVPPRIEATLTLRSDGEMRGSTGCNSYQSRYRLDGDRLRVPRAVIATQMACGPAVMRVERAMLDILSAADRATADRTGLVVTARDGRAIRFEAR